MSADLLALAVGRPAFVLAKPVVAAAWWFLLVISDLVEAFVVGALLGLPGFSTVAAAGVREALLAAGIACLLVPLIARVTLLGRGYIAPLGLAIAALALGNVFSRTGWAPESA